MLHSFAFILIASLSLPPAGHAAKIERVELKHAEKSKFAESCDIQIHFGSYASGIDHAVKEKIFNNIESTKDPLEAYTWHWGREGELSLCLKMQDSLVESKYRDLKKFIPAESKTAWTEIKRKGQESFKTKWPKSP